MNTTAIQVIEKAQQLGDYGTESMLKSLTKEIEQDYVVFALWLK